MQISFGVAMIITPSKSISKFLLKIVLTSIAWWTLINISWASLDLDCYEHSVKILTKCKLLTLTFNYKPSQFHWLRSIEEIPFLTFLQRLQPSFAVQLHRINVCPRFCQILYCFYKWVELHLTENVIARENVKNPEIK